jgi:hypothetical protein
VSVEDDEWSGWQSTSKMIENVEKTWELIHQDHRQQSMSSQTSLGSFMKLDRY